MPRRQSLLGHYAGFASRLVAFIIDQALVAISVSATIWIIATAWNMLQFSAIVDVTRLPQPSTLIDMQLIAGVFATTTYVIYHLFFLITTGRTPGKALMGLRVVTINGGRLSFIHAVLRLLGYLVSTVTLFLGFLWILIDNRRQGFHDKLARTYVVYAWSARPDERFLAYQIERLGSPD